MLIQGLRCRGFSLIELTIALAVSGLVLGGIWTFYSSGKENESINQTVEELQAIVRGVLDIQNGRQFSAAANTTITQNMISAGVIPSWAVTSPTSAIYPWGTLDIRFLGTMGWAPAWATGPNEFEVVFYGNIPTDACTALATQAMNCQYGQLGCPVSIGFANCCEAMPATATAGWQSMIPDPATWATNQCVINTADLKAWLSGGNPANGFRSVAFQYIAQ
jgi:prepilin-type N-terminal cleavage/methylation domain-containing protein